MNKTEIRKKILGIRKNNNKNLQINFKDISRILQKPIHNFIGMTGEIDLNGNVTKIGGLEYKINGAKKAGITKIILSNENKKDYEKIKKNDPKLFENLEIVCVDFIDEIIDHALLL